MKLTFLGSGDAFGTGGRFNTCFCEAYFRGRKVPGHMDVDDLLPRLEIDL